MYFCATGYVSVTEQELDCDGGEKQSFVLGISKLDVISSCQNAGRNHDVLCTGEAGRMLGTEKMFRSNLHLSVPAE